MDHVPSDAVRPDPAVSGGDQVEHLRQRLAVAESRLAELTAAGKSATTSSEKQEEATASLGALPLSAEMLRTLADVVPQIIWANTAKGIA